MKGMGKFCVLSAVSLLALMVLVQLFSGFINDSSTEIIDADLISGWFWYRMGFYVLVIAAWRPICRFMTRPRFNLRELSDEQKKTYTQERARDIQYLQSQWWKVALLFTFVEVVIIQQFGFK